jgi:hypothetical protein
MVTRINWWQAFAGLALVGSVAGCGELQVENSNAPERERAFSDPATIIASAAGTVKTLLNMRYSNLSNSDPGLTLSAMGDSYTMSWNNFNARYYSSYGPGGGANCPDRCGWQNSTATQLGDQINPFWYGSYSVLSSANDALFAIRVAAEPPDLGTEAERTEVIAQLSQAMAMGWVSLTYDQGFIVLEDTDPAALTIEPREALRDKAIELFENGITLAKAAAPFETATDWFGVPTGPIYTNLQLAKVMRTAQAELLAHFPRNADENAQVNWAKVAEYASKGITSSVDGAPFEWDAFMDVNNTFYDGTEQWGNDYTTVRVDTRVARLLSTTQNDPWVAPRSPRPQDASGNPIGGLYGVDKRLGDGCYDAGTGDANLFGHGECAETAQSGTDFVYLTTNIFNPGRGLYHHSNIGHIRNHCLALSGTPDCPVLEGRMPLYSSAFNDLLWAEGLLRSNGSKAEAAARINASRVGRGGLPPVSAGDPTEVLLRAMLYEQDVELVQHSGTQYFNRRRVSKSTFTHTGVNQYTADLRNHYADPEGPHVLNTLWENTPRHFPIPAKDLALLLAEIYSFGGVGNPAGVSAPMNPWANSRVKGVREIYAEMQKKSFANRFPN